MDDLRIGAAAGREAREAAGTAASGGTVPGDQGAGGFWGSLKEAIAQVNDVQLEASRTVDGFVSGEHQNVHQMMVALQKADVSFQLMMQVRNKLVSAYEDIQRMQV
ncbi:flagellar hook-basal body complex protein FliE [Candidatus Nitrospira bockiana]